MREREKGERRGRGKTDRLKKTTIHIIILARKIFSLVMQWPVNPVSTLLAHTPHTAQHIMYFLGTLVVVPLQV